MPELRKDPVIGRWVIIATERARRPGNIVDRFSRPVSDDQKPCPYCDLKVTPKTIGDVPVVPYQVSLFNQEQSASFHSHGLYSVVQGYGVHDIIIESKEHIANMADLDRRQICRVFQAYQKYVEELKKNKHLKYIYIYKNYGTIAGSRDIDHARSHIIATPVLPLLVKEKLEGARAYYQEKGSCVYCDMIKQEAAVRSRVVAETDNFIVIIPYAACFLFEVMLFPKAHHQDFTVGMIGFEDELADVLKMLLTKLKKGLDDVSYNYFIHTAPLQSKQDSDEYWEHIEEGCHWHMVLIPRLTRMAGFEKGTGFYISPIPPEDAAEYLREYKV